MEEGISALGWLFLHQAKTLRERAFARLVVGLTGPALTLRYSPSGVIYDVRPQAPTLAGLMTANTFGAREHLSKLPIVNPDTYGGLHRDPELVPALQDLAELIAWEAEQAVSAKYYPRMPEVDVPEDHVKVVMKALQREMDREGMSRRRTPPVYAELPWERQCALAERRRYWYGQFGITPERWETGTWSLWEVAEIEMPKK